ncbi:ATP-binding protein [Kineococcus sp. SYSU DK004]|uniref:ATP-binding protein n=1 Tax=Kineococcus sp. SYSU DK004 TaxID=3383125 RepID=UPI003D7DA264
MDHLLLHAHPSVAAAARHFVTAWCTAHGFRGDVTDTTELLTSELVGNALRHGSGRIVVSITDGAPAALAPPDPHQVLVTVADSGAGRPRTRPAPADATDGRGLHLVDALARAWGVTPHAAPGTCHPSPPLTAAGLEGATGGKTTWFTVDAAGG